MSTGTYTCKKGGRRRFRVRKRYILLINILLLAVLIAAVFMLARILISYRASRSAYDDLSARVLTSAAPSEEPAAAAVPDMETPVPTSAPISGSLAWMEEESVQNDAAAAAQSEVGFTVDWKQPKKLNKDVKAWLYCADTNINYPVVQYTDNAYYLTHRFENGEDDTGTLFFDYRNALSAGRENWVIYGHRRNDKSMFGSLAKYAERSYLEKHPNMYLLMEDRTYRVEIFACRTVHADKKYFTLWFNSDAEYADYLNRALQQSYWSPDAEPGTETPILTLATCSTYIGDNEPRLLVHGRLVRIGGQE